MNHVKKPFGVLALLLLTVEYGIREEARGNIVNIIPGSAVVLHGVRQKSFSPWALDAFGYCR